MRFVSLALNLYDEKRENVWKCWKYKELNEISVERLGGQVTNLLLANFSAYKIQGGKQKLLLVKKVRWEQIERDDFFYQL